MSPSVVAIPDKDEFKINEVCEITGVQPFVLRYWEQEFPDLHPDKEKGGQRVYRREDVLLILKIKKLLYDEKFTIAGAKQRLAEEKHTKTTSQEVALDKGTGNQVEKLRRALAKAKRELAAILEELS